MIYEQFKERKDRGYYQENTRFWGFILQYRNILAPPSRHLPPTEMEMTMTYERFSKVSAKTGRTLHTLVYPQVASLFDDDVRHNGDSEYLFEIFETKEECMEGYRDCVQFWQRILDQRLEAQMAAFNQQRVNIGNYLDKVQ